MGLPPLAIFPGLTSGNEEQKKGDSAKEVLSEPGFVLAPAIGQIQPERTE